MMKKMIVVFLLIITVVWFSGCDTYGAFHRYPWYKSDTWYCEETDMIIYFPLDEEGELRCPGIAEFAWNGEKYNLGVHFQTNAYWFSKTENNLARSVFGGVWEYHAGKLVFYISQDKMFDGEYSKMEFIPK